MSEKSKSPGYVPTKQCPACQSRFAWRKEWAQCWHRVVYCCSQCATGTGEPVADASRPGIAIDEKVPEERTGSC